jgi:hypothetical protein
LVREHAAADYVAGEANLGVAAARAAVEVERMIGESDGRGIGTIGSTHYRASLGNLAELFGGSPAIRSTLADQRLHAGSLEQAAARG